VGRNGFGHFQQSFITRAGGVRPDRWRRGHRNVAPELLQP
jgi:hypothetical protein